MSDETTVVPLPLDRQPKKVQRLAAQEQAHVKPQTQPLSGSHIGTIYDVILERSCDCEYNEGEERYEDCDGDECSCGEATLTLSIRVGDAYVYVPLNDHAYNITCKINDWENGEF